MLEIWPYNGRPVSSGLHRSSGGLSPQPRCVPLRGLDQVPHIEVRKAAPGALDCLRCVGAEVQRPACEASKPARSGNNRYIDVIRPVLGAVNRRGGRRSERVIGRKTLFLKYITKGTVYGDVSYRSPLITCQHHHTSLHNAPVRTDNAVPALWASNGALHCLPVVQAPRYQYELERYGVYDRSDML